jgi:uncharacterized protein
MQGRHSAQAHARRSRVARRCVPVLRTFLWISLLSLESAGCTPKPEVVIHTREQPVRVTVELALTPEQHERGLMYRQSLPADSGMLFIFPGTEIRSFWMKNTPLPLDMIFIDDDKEIVGIVENTVPFSTNNRTIPRPARYVLEVNGGFAAQHGIKAGQSVDIPATPPSR